MSPSTRLHPLTAATAPEGSRAMITGSERKFGFVPSPVARAAHAPVALKHLLAGFAAFEQTSLMPMEREVVAMTVAFENECHYCMAMHSALLHASPDAAPLAPALRDGEPLADARLEALRVFARALVRERGRVGEAEWAALEAAGFTEAQALEVVLGVGVYVTSTFMNIVMQAELDPPFAPFAWQHPARRPVAATA